MRAFLAILFTATLAAPSLARADQCALNDPQINTRAVELAKQSTAVIEYCEPCKGGSMRGPFTIHSVGVRGREVEINGKPVDLAYVFVHTKGDEYTNLGLAAGCAATGISRVIRSPRPAIPPPPAPMSNPPPPSRPYTPPPRVTSADDIAGTWNVTIRGSVSTCGPAPASRTATWTITSSGVTLSLLTDTGRELVAPLPVLDRGSIRVELKDSKQSVFQTTQFMKDHLSGRFLIVEKGCAVVYDVWARRAG
jgi:hypothetical protein